MKRDPKKSRFNFEELKEGATSSDRERRKNIFIEYFERFQEFPSYFFDNERAVDARLSETIKDLSADPELDESMRRGLKLLLARLPSLDVIPENS